MADETDTVLEKNSAGVFRTANGTMSVFLEPLQPRPTLLIAGAGHVGRHSVTSAIGWILTSLSLTIGQILRQKARLPEADEIIIGDIAGELRKYPISRLTYVVIVTRGHQHDESALHSVVESDARYIGLIGSRRKIKLIFDDLREAGVSMENLRRVHAPIGWIFIQRRCRRLR